MRAASLIALSFLITAWSQAQTTSETFDVASVKVSAMPMGCGGPGGPGGPGGGGRGGRGVSGGPGTNDPSRIRFQSATLTIDFEGLADGTSVTNQYAGLLFSNATILTAGVSLNEVEFPPHSGINVVFDDGGPISIVFSPDVLSFQAYFTYLEPLTATAYDDMSNPVDAATSLYSSNLAFSTTNPPNELILLNYAGGINEVVVAGDPNGASFVMDDVTITTPSTATPEPSSIVPLAALLVCLCLFNTKANHRALFHNVR